MLTLDEPLGFGTNCRGSDVLRFVYELDIPLVNGRVPFHRAIYELVRRCSFAEIPEGALRDELDRMVTRKFKDLTADEYLNFSVAVSVMRIQRKWRARVRANKWRRARLHRLERQRLPPLSEVIDNRGALIEKLHTLRHANPFGDGKANRKWKVVDKEWRHMLYSDKLLRRVMDKLY